MRHGVPEHVQRPAGELARRLREPASLKSKTDPTVDYMGPEHGPFRCGRCVHFRAGACELVAGQIDPNGCCNLFHD